MFLFTVQSEVESQVNYCCVGSLKRRVVVVHHHPARPWGPGRRTAESREGPFAVFVAPDVTRVDMWILVAAAGRPYDSTSGRLNLTKPHE